MYYNIERDQRILSLDIFMLLLLHYGSLDKDSFDFWHVFACWFQK